MAEKSEDKCSVEEKITQAKELIARGTRNYFIDAYADAADDLSQACSIYATLFGQNADELGRPYLLYAKSLIAVAQDENKLMEIPEEDEGNEDDDDEDGDENEDEAENDDEQNEAEDSAEPQKEKTGDEPVNQNKTDEEKSAVSNGHANKSEVDSASAETEPKPESSTSNGQDAAEPVKDGEGGDETKEDDEDDSAASLQVAWEVLELAVKIFEKQGDSALPNLADAHNELANISFENSFFNVAINDYTKSYEIYLDLPEPNRRILAELQYKIGLCHIMLNDFENSVKSLKKSCEIFDEEIAAEKAKENQSDDVQKTVKDLEETKQEILNKIIDVEESKLQSTEEVKRELAKLIAIKNGGGDDVGAGPSSSSSLASLSVTTGFGEGGANSSSPTTTSSEASKPKPSDISHLIKRKKPSEDKPVETNSSASIDDDVAAPPPAKKPSL